MPRPLEQLSTMEAVEKIEIRALKLLQESPSDYTVKAIYLAAAEIMLALTEVLRGGFTR